MRHSVGLRQVTAFGRPLRPLFFVVSFPCERSPVVGALGPLSPETPLQLRPWQLIPPPPFWREVGVESPAALQRTPHNPHKDEGGGGLCTAFGPQIACSRFATSAGHSTSGASLYAPPTRTRRRLSPTQTRSSGIADLYRGRLRMRTNCASSPPATSGTSPPNFRSAHSLYSGSRGGARRPAAPAARCRAAARSI